MSDTMPELQCPDARGDETQDKRYEPGILATPLSSWPRTDRAAEGATLASLRLQPSERDAEKRAMQGPCTVESFVEGWIRDLSLFALCKVQSKGELLPFPVDLIMDHPSFKSVEPSIWLVLKKGC